MSALLYLIAFGFMFAVGLFAIPAYIQILATPIGNNVLGKVMFILGQFAHEGSMIRYNGDSTVDILPYDRETNRVYDDGEWHELDEEPTTYRIGWNTIVVDCDGVSSAPANTVVEREQLPAGVVADGGSAPIDETRGGMALYTDADPSKPIIHYPRYLQQMGRQGNELINRAKEQALEKYGGDDQTSNTFLAMLLLGGFVVMFTLTFGMLLVM